MKKILIIALCALTLYLTLWPIDVEPVAWQAPDNKGYQEEFVKNDKLTPLEKISLNGSEGPEAIALSQQGLVYFSLLNGDINYLDAQGKVQHYVNTQGRPLGLAFDKKGALIVADAFRGLLKVTSDKALTVRLVPSIVTEPFSAI